jgi:aspartate/methionine/tyrosine aminotransferase
VNPRLAAIPPSIIRALHGRKRPDDIDLGLGEPTLRPDPGPFEAALDWVRAKGCPYTPNAGDEELRERIAQYHGSGDAERVCVTVGSEEALYLAIKALLDPARDEALIVSPAYLAYEKICAMEGVHARTADLDPEDGFAPSADRVLNALGPRTRMVVLNSPCNPTGRVWPEAELEALASGLRSRSSDGPIWLLADEVYRELYYGNGDGPAPSVAGMYEHAVVASSLSKSDALTGLRLGWLYGPPEAVALATRAHQLVNTAASTFSQRVAIEVMKSAGPGAHRGAYLRRRAALLELLQDHGLDAAAPEGAFYCMLRLPAGLADDSLAASTALLEEARVVTVPGVAFGAAGEGWIRISWCGDEDTLREGVGRIARYFGEAEAA